MAQIYTSALLIPSQEEFEKILTAKISYENASKKSTAERDAWCKKNFTLTPWGIGYTLSKKKYDMSVNAARAKNKIKPPEPTAQLLRYFIIAVTIDWTELIDQLKRTLKIWGYTSEDLQQMAKDVWQNAAIPNQIVTTLMSAQNGSNIILKEAIEKHNTLNPKLFTKDGELKEKVRDKMLEIVDEFVANLKEQDVKLKIDDILFIGSNASYNFTANSDIDLHILANTKAVKYPEDLGAALYSAYRSLFNKSLDIEIYDIPVEIFVETEDSARVSNGIYSVKKDKWIKRPIQEDIPEYDKEALKELVDKWETKCKNLIKDVEADKLNDEKKVIKLLEDIYEQLRKKGIAKGEYNILNLAFKELRNVGYLDKLKEYRDKLVSKRLSLEEELEAQNNFKKQDCILKIAGNYQVQFTSSDMFIISNIKERDVSTLYDDLLKLTFVKGLTYEEQSYFDPRISNYNVMLSKQYKIKGSIK